MREQYDIWILQKSHAEWEGSQEYVLYNYVEDKEITKIDLGEFDWNDYINGGYLFLCSSGKGAYILDETTREIVLKIPDASTLYTFDAPEGQPYFTALYLSDNGETRLDVYEKSELFSLQRELRAVLE